MFDEKGQLHTLEGVAAATILLLVIVYAIDATSMTPLTSSTSSLHTEYEIRALGQDVLNMIDYAEPGYNSALKNSILQWDGNEYIWNGSAYIIKGGTSPLTNSSLAAILIATLTRQGIAHNVAINFLDNGTPVSRNMIYNGDPSFSAVVVSRKIVLQNTDSNNPGNPIKDIDPSTNLYNVVDVKLILWRT
jgi:hypothetical protein